MADVKWLKFKVGMFDGHSFKRIKRAKIDGVVDFRDKLTAVWFELIDLAGKVNNNGFFFNDEIAYQKYDDIAIMLDRTEKEIELCINWFIDNDMMEILNNHFLLSNFTKYQNADGLLKIQEQNRERQRRYRESKKVSLIDSNVTNTLRNDNTLISISNTKSLSNTLKDSDIKEVDNGRTKKDNVQNMSNNDTKTVTTKSKTFIKPTLEEVTAYCNERNNGVDPNKFINFYESKGWMVGKNKMKDWKASVRTWEEPKVKKQKLENIGSVTEL